MQWIWHAVVQCCREIWNLNIQYCIFMWPNICLKNLPAKTQNRVKKLAAEGGAANLWAETLYCFFFKKKGSSWRKNICGFLEINYRIARNSYESSKSCWNPNSCHHGPTFFCFDFSKKSVIDGIRNQYYPRSKSQKTWCFQKAKVFSKKHFLEHRTL